MIADLITIANDTAAASTSLEAALAQARTTAAQAAADFTAAGDAYRDGLLGPEKVLPKLLMAQTEARTGRDRADALVALLEQRHAEAVAVEAEAARTEAYVTATMLRDAAASRLETEYPDLVAQLLELLREVATADIAVARANADLPADVAKLAHVEMVARSLPGAPREVLSEQVLALWCPEGSTEPFPDDRQRGIVHQGGGLGYRSSRSGTGQILCERRLFRRVRFRAAIRPAYPASLVDTLVLPPLKSGEALAWKPDMASPLAPSPDRTLARIEQIEAALLAGPKAQERPIEVEHLPPEPGEDGCDTFPLVGDGTPVPQERYRPSALHVPFQPIDAEYDHEAERDHEVELAGTLT